MPSPAHPTRRLLVAVDMERYGSQDNLRQFQSQQTLREVLDESAAAVGLHRSTWLTQPTGDGELAVLPPEAPEPVVISDLVRALDRLLRERNRSLIPGAKVRLRVAVHQGLVHSDGANGWAGQAVVDVCRLLEARPLKRALAMFKDAGAALIVSDALYQDVVRQEYAGIRPDRFRAVRVEHLDKNFRAPAWIHVPDEDVTGRRDMLIEPEVEQHEPDPGHGHPAPADVDPQPPGLRAGPDRYHFGTVTTHGPAVFGAGGTAIGAINHGGAR